MKNHLCFLILILYYNKIIIFKSGDWGLGIGDWGLGIGDWAQSPIPNPQSPIPNPHKFKQKIILFFYFYYFKIKNTIYLFILCIYDMKIIL